jgi:hypothetical protein
MRFSARPAVLRPQGSSDVNGATAAESGGGAGRKVMQRIVFVEACQLGCEGIVSKRLGSLYRPRRSAYWVKVKNPKAPAVKREAEEDWGR